MKFLNVGYGIRERLHDLLGRFKITSGAIVPTDISANSLGIQNLLNDNIKELGSAVFGSYWSKDGGSVVFMGKAQISYSGNTLILSPFMGITRSGRWVRSPDLLAITGVSGFKYIFIDAVDEEDTSFTKSDFHDGTSSYTVLRNQPMTNSLSTRIHLESSDTSAAHTDRILLGYFDGTAFFASTSFTQSVVDARMVEHDEGLAKLMGTAALGAYWNLDGGSVIFLENPCTGVYDSASETLQLAPFIGITRSGRIVYSRSHINMSDVTDYSYLYVDATSDVQEITTASSIVMSSSHSLPTDTNRLFLGRAVSGSAPGDPDKFIIAPMFMKSAIAYAYSY